MNVFESVRIALRALAANKLRGMLTMLGVIIGVAAVIALMSLGKGAQTKITSQVQSLGTNLLFVNPGQAQSQTGVSSGAGFAQTLTYNDAEAITTNLSDLVVGVAPERSTGAQLIVGGQNWRSRVIGVTPDYEAIRNFHVASGEFITQTHLDTRSTVIVLGSGVVQNLFGDSDPIDQTVRISAFGDVGLNVRVIGVMESKGGSGLQNQDDQTFMPLTTVSTRLAPARTLQSADMVSTITVQVANESAIDEAIQQIGELLRERHRVAQDDFVVSSQRDFLNTISQVTGLFTAFLGAVAGISLVVGGIGIMNIMLVSVTERTREIGIRKAVGARRRDVLAQFMIEAIIVSLAGGVLGILVGAAISHLVGGVSFSGQTIPSVISADAMALAFSVSAAVGLFFGIYPAMRASRLNPIDALRWE